MFIKKKAKRFKEFCEVNLKQNKSQEYKSNVNLDKIKVENVVEIEMK